MTARRTAVLACLLVAASAARGGEPPAVVPNPALTPGAVYAASEAEVCGRVGGLTYERRSRAALTASDKAAIVRAYGQEPGRLGDHQLDHLVPAALAGRSDATNVWLQPGRGHGTAWTYEVKDRLDAAIWREVCVRHGMTLAQGQAMFLVPDWRESYCAYFLGMPPCPP